MQEYTSLETSRKIYEMFGWGNDIGKYWDNNRLVDYISVPCVPAYTLPYLLDKLPVSLLIEKAGGKIHSHFMIERLHGGAWSAVYPGRHDISVPSHEFVVEAAALLCLELGKQGILPGKDK